MKQTKKKAFDAEFIRVTKETLSALKASRAGSREGAILTDQRFTGNQHTDGWMRLDDILGAAMDDEQIISSPGASAFLSDLKQLTLMTCMQLVNGSAETDDAFAGIKAFLPLAADLAGEQLRDNTGREKGTATTKKRKEAHVDHLRGAVLDILKNPRTSDWNDPKIARWLMEPKQGFHKFEGRELKEKAMTNHVKEIRAAYKASI